MIEKQMTNEQLEALNVRRKKLGLQPLKRETALRLVREHPDFHPDNHLQPFDWITFLVGWENLATTNAPQGDVIAEVHTDLSKHEGSFGGAGATASFDAPDQAAPAPQEAPVSTPAPEPAPAPQEAPAPAWTPSEPLSVDTSSSSSFDSTPSPSVDNSLT